MSVRSFIHVLLAMFCTVVFCFLAPTVNATTLDAPVFVRQVTLSKGNWLWHHYMHMSPSYRKVHTFTSFMETEACFLVERKCTEADWRHVSRKQKIYVPTENVMLKAGRNESTTTLLLSPHAIGNGLYSLHVSTVPLVQAQETALNDRITNLEFINHDLRSKYSALVVTHQYIVIVASLFVLAFLVLIFVMWRTYKRKNEEIADLEDDLKEWGTLRDAPKQAEVTSTAEAVVALQRIAAINETTARSFPTSMELVFKEFDSVHGTGYAEDEVHQRVYLINRKTIGFHEQLQRDERFLARTMYPNFVEQIFEK